jgi:protein O-mannosyl-transferase
MVGPGFLLLAFVAYWPALKGEFVYDDAAWTTMLSHLHQDVHGLWRMWTEPTVLQQYYPVTATSFWIDHRLWAWQPLGWHVENVLLHGCAAWLFWSLLARLAVPGAWFAAAVFAVHPMMVESVAWVTERKNVLSLVLMLWSMRVYLRFDGLGIRAVAPRNRWAYALSFALFLAAMLAKVSAFVMPPTMLLLIWWKRGRVEWRRDALPLVPFFVVALVLSRAAVWMEENVVGAEGERFDLPLAHRFLVAGRALWFYAAKLTWPRDLCVMYPRWELDSGSPAQWLFPAGIVLAAWGVFAARRWLGRGVLVALLYFVGALVPVLGFMKVFGMSLSFVADRWCYFASLGWFALLAAALSRVANRRLPSWACRGAAGLMIVGLAMLTRSRSAVWTSKEVLWRTTIRQNPRSAQAHNNLAAALGDKGLSDSAAEHSRIALELDPHNLEAEMNLAMVSRHQGRKIEAIRQYEQIVGRHPDLHRPELALANTLMEAGRPDDAMPHYHRAIELATKSPAPYVDLGDALCSTGAYSQAVEYYHRALALMANSVPIRFRLGRALVELGRVDDAEREFRECVAIDPGFADAQNALGIVLLQRGRSDEAVGPLAEAVRLNPGDAAKRANFGYALVKAGRFREGAGAYEAALKLDAGLQAALVNFAWLCATCPDPAFRDGRRAVEMAERANRVARGANLFLLRALGAAYAETERWQDSMDVTARALESALATGNSEMAGLLRSDRAHYERKEALVERRSGR